MAFTANYSERDYPPLDNAYVRIQSYQEYQKNCILVIVGIWRNPTDVVSGVDPVTLRRFYIDTTNLVTTDGIRSGIYTLLKAETAFSNITDDTDVVAPEIPFPQ